MSSLGPPGPEVGSVVGGPDRYLDAQLVDIVFGQVPMGVAVFGTDLRLWRCNPTWAGFLNRYFDAPDGTVAPGREFFELFARHEEALAPLVQDVLAGRVVRRSVQRLSDRGVVTYWDLVFAPMFVDGEVIGFVDVVTDATDRVRANEVLEQRIATLAAVADAMTVAHPLGQTLQLVARLVRGATSAAAVAAVVWHDASLDSVTAYGDAGLPQGYRAALHEVNANGGTWPLRAAGTDDVVTVVRGFRSMVRDDPRFTPLHELHVGLDFEDVVVVRLASRSTVSGCLLLYVRAGRQIAAEERTFLEAVANQVAVAVENARLVGQAEANATLLERQRLARELHDSVSQALFSMTLHARTAERQLASHGIAAEDPVATSLARLSDLARGSLAEMRALIFELRPAGLETEGLVEALRQQAAQLARDDLAIAVDGPAERLPLDARAEQHLYRLAAEALNNSVKHAGATTIRVQVDVEPSRPAPVLHVRVLDDGRGFDPAAVPPGRLGQATMRDRAAALGAALTVRTAPGQGCAVIVSLPLHDPGTL